MIVLVRPMIQSVSDSPVLYDDTLIISRTTVPTHLTANILPRRWRESIAPWINSWSSWRWEEGEEALRKTSLGGNEREGLSKRKIRLESSRRKKRKEKILWWRVLVSCSILLSGVVKVLKRKLKIWAEIKSLHSAPVWTVEVSFQKRTWILNT